MPIIIDPRTGLPVPRRTDRAPRNKRQGGVPGPGDVAQVDAQVLRDPGLHATPADFGAGIGKAVEAFGKAASRVAADFAEMRREAEDDTAAAAALSEARARFTRVVRSANPQATTAGDFTGNLDRDLGAEIDAIVRDLRDVRGLRPSKEGEAAIRLQLGLLASRTVARGAMFEQTERLAQLGRDVDLSVAEAALAAFDSPADFLAIMGETEASLARFKNKLPPDILAAKVAAARGLIAANAAAGLIELDPALAIEGLKGEFFGDSLPAADRKRLRARAKAAQRDRRAQAELGQARDRATAGADGARRLVVLEGAIERGEAGEQAIAEAADILDQPTRARLHEMLKARRAEDAARARRIEKVSAVLAGRAPAVDAGDLHTVAEDLRPGTPEWLQAVDDHYASLADTLETMDPDERARFEVDYARATGVLPKPVEKRLRAGLLSGDPAAQAAAATHLVRLKDVDPALVPNIPAVERRLAQDIAGFVDLGLPPPRAVELAKKKRARGVLPSEDPIGGEGGADSEKDTPGGDGAVDAGDGGQKRSGGDGPEPRASPDDDTPEDGAPRGSGPDADVVPSARNLGTDGLSGVRKRRIADAKAEFDKLEGLQPGSPGFRRARERLSRLQQRLTKTERLELFRQVVADIPLRGLAGRAPDRVLADGQPNRPTGELRRPSFRHEFVENTLLGQLTLKPLGDAIAGLRGMAGLDPVNPFSGRILSKKEVQETNVLTLVGAGFAGAGRLATLARNIPAPRSLGNVKARQWYHQQLDAIPDALDGSRPLDVQARLAHRLRNEARDTGREAMKDLEGAKTLSPNWTFEEMIQKARDRGLEGDGIWRYIIEAAKRSNPVVDKSLGVTRKK